MNTPKRPPFFGFHPPDEYARLEREWWEKENKKQIGKLKEEIAAILARLDQSCIRPTAKSPFKWPEESELERLDKIVEDLARLVRKRKLLVLWDFYEAVDRKFHDIRLLKRIKELVLRAKHNTEPRPMEAFARMQVDGSHCPLAIEFFKIWKDFRQERLVVHSVEWKKFSPLFARYRRGVDDSEGAAAEAVLKSKLGDKPGDPTLVAYTVFLEIASEDRAWARENYKDVWDLTTWIISRLKNPELNRMLERFCDPVDLKFLDESMTSHREMARRRRDRWKVRRFRQKKGK